MKVFDSIQDFNNYNQSNITLVIGSFDGMHIGHKELLTFAKNQNTAYSLVVLTFSPHPKIFFKPDLRHLVYDSNKKISALEKNGVDYIINLPFDSRLQQMAAKDFCQQYLLKINKFKSLYLGYDSSLGRDMESDVETLNLYLEGVDINKGKDIKLEGRTVSSSWLRESILDSQFELFKNLTGDYFRFSGTVVHGKKIGRKINYPTANLNLHDNQIIPKPGVYGALVYIGDRLYKAGLNIGFNPTVATEDSVKVEAHLLGLDSDIYEKEIELEPRFKIREEMKFDSLDDLKQQIAKDLLTLKEKL